MNPNQSEEGSDMAPQTNPVIKFYENWSRTTPAVARLSMITIVITYLISWFIDLERYLSNQPFFTIFHFEVYRLVFSPFVGNSFFTVILSALFYPVMAGRLEQSIGSAGMIFLLLTLVLVTNLTFVLICFLFYVMGSQVAIFWSAAGFFSLIFSLMVIECMKVPEAPRRMFFIPIDIPGKYFPLALYAFMMLLGGPRLDDLVGIGIGYAYSFGYLETLSVSDSFLSRQETSGFLAGAYQTQGWLSAGSALGHQAWLPVANRDVDEEQGGANSGSGFAGMFSGGDGSASSRAEPANPFPGSGQTVSSAGHPAGGGGSTLPPAKPLSKADRQAVAERRLQALGLTSAPSSVAESQPAIAVAQPYRPSAPALGEDAAFDALTDMGFTADRARQALHKSGGDMEAALAYLTN
jgi:hypothetical protein